METFYLFLIIFLFVLAVFDLSVGVSNDAVNFMNSAIGSKAASFKVIMVIAAIGIFVGASLSNGMMDIARHGIYQPQHFYFSEIMCILLAVMLTDVVLLDIFNSLGMPTSTTVSLVFELINGTVFDSSVQRGEPAVFGVSQVIPGWVEALQLMPVGSKWRLFIPSNLAYGEHGAGDAIEPNSALVFDVELLDIVK